MGTQAEEHIREKNIKQTSDENKEKYQSGNH